MEIKELFDIRDKIINGTASENEIMNHQFYLASSHFDSRLYDAFYELRNLVRRREKMNKVLKEINCEFDEVIEGFH